MWLQAREEVITPLQFSQTPANPLNNGPPYWSATGRAVGGAVIGPDSSSNSALEEACSLREIPDGITASAASTTQLQATGPPARPGFLQAGEAKEKCFVKHLKIL